MKTVPAHSRLALLPLPLGGPFKKGLPIVQPSPHFARIANALKSCARSPLFLIIIIISGLATNSALAQNSNTGTTTNRTTTATPDEPQDTEEQEAKPQPTPNAPAKSVVKGRITYEDSNRPVRRARLMLLQTDGEGRMEKTGVTDERGEFSIKEVGAGNYIMVVDSPGIVSPFSSVELEEGMDERSALVSLRREFSEISVNGTNTVEVQIRAKRGGIVTGRVNYQDGDPAVNAQIVIMRKKGNRMTRFITGFSPYSMLSLKTDDRGVYRIAGLPPGEYVLGASEANTREDMREEYASVFGGSNFGVSYYQNETSLQQATPVKIEAGQEAGDINITIIDRATYTISGTAVSRPGRKPVSARLTLQTKTEASALPFADLGPTASTDAQGGWEFANVPEGTYVIKVEPASNADEEPEEAAAATTTYAQAKAANTAPSVPRRPSLVPRQQEVTVSGGDLTGVVIEVSEGGRIRGTVLVEGGDKPPQLAFNAVLTPRDGGPSLDRYVYAQTGAFLIDRIPAGEFYLSIQQLSDKLYVKSITAGGTDLLREPLRITGGASIDNARIVIGADVATLQGRVASSNDAKPVRGAVVLLVPSDPVRWRSTGSYMPGVTESDGTFKLTAAPGSYLLLVLAEGENLREVNESFIRARAGSAKAVTLQPNGRETVELVAPGAVRP
jgi:hypothetical protein